MLTAMNYRTESRGPHYRLDHPEKDGAQNGFITLRRGSSGFDLILHKTNV